MRETRKIYKICPRHTIRNLRNAPVQLSWERNLQMAATFPSSSPGNTRPIPLLPNILTTCPKSSLLPNMLTTLLLPDILTSYPGTTKYIYCCPIYPPSPPVYRCSRIKPRPWYVKAEHLISSANDPICSFRRPGCLNSVATKWARRQCESFKGLIQCEAWG